MFVLCPHCQFLVALDAASGQPPPRCSRCDGALLPAGAAPESPGVVASAPAAVVASEVVAAAETADATRPAATASAAVDASEDDRASAPAEAVAAGSGDIDPAPPPATTAAASDASAAPPASPAPAAAADNDRDSGSDERAPPAAADAEVAQPEATLDAAADSPVVASAAAGMPAAAQPRTPSFVAAPVATGSRRRWRAPVAIAALSLLLGLQLLLAERATLAADAGWRPWLSGLCNVLRCTLPPWREPAAFALLQRDVRAHPRIAGALQVTATFRNDARWPQPWPALLLTLADVDGRPVGARLFAPREYLGGAPTQNTLAAGQSATVAMEVLEPAPRIVAFTFDFR